MEWRSPELFGPHYWKVFHSTAASYPTKFTPNDVMVYGWFFQLFGYILPCLQCSQEYARLIELYGMMLYQSLVKRRIYVWVWSVIIHNEVNVRLHKPVVTIDAIAHQYGFAVAEAQAVMEELTSTNKLSKNLQQQLPPTQQLLLQQQQQQRQQSHQPPRQQPQQQQQSQQQQQPQQTRRSIRIQETPMTRSVPSTRRSSRTSLRQLLQ